MECNESAGIVRLFGAVSNDGDVNLYPDEKRAEIDQWNAWIVEQIVQHSYQVVFPGPETDLSKTTKRLSDALGKLNDLLSAQDFIIGETVTESDILLFPTLVRHGKYSTRILVLISTLDIVYVPMFGISKKIEDEFPNIHAWIQRMTKLPGISETINLEHFQSHYTAIKNSS